MSEKKLTRRKWSKAIEVCASLSLASALCFVASCLLPDTPLGRIGLWIGVAAAVLGILGLTLAHHLNKGRRRRIRYISLAGVLIVVVSLPLPLLVGARVLESKRRAACGKNLQQIGYACIIYAEENDGAYPPDLESLGSEYLSDQEVLTCPSARNGWGGCRARPTNPVDYAYIGAGIPADLPADLAGRLVLAYDKSPANHDRDGHTPGFNVLFADGHVEWRLSSSEAKFQERLKKQREVVKKWREAGAKKEDLQKFFGK